MKLHVGNRFFSSTAFIDLLFNIIVGVAFLFLIAFLLINPVSKKNDIESKADFFIILNWDNKSHADIDLWIRDPIDNVMSFKSKDIGFMHLDRDDLGSRNDKITLPDGSVKFLEMNREIAALRGTINGWYIVNVHVYRKNRTIDPADGVLRFIPTNATIELIQVNPYKMITGEELILVKQGQEVTVFAFRMIDGEVIEWKADDISFVSLLGYTDGNETPEETNHEGSAQRFFNGWSPYGNGW